MPGTPTIRWNENSDALMLKALLYYGNIKINDDVAAKIAAYLGENVTASAIHSHITIVRGRMKKELGAAANTDAPGAGPSATAAGPSRASPKKRSATSPLAKIPGKKGKQKTEESEEEDDEDPGEDKGGAAGAAAEFKGKARLRSSARTPRSINYGTLHDPFTTLAGTLSDDGEAVFGATRADESEDSQDGDVFKPTE